MDRSSQSAKRYALNTAADDFNLRKTRKMEEMMRLPAQAPGVLRGPSTVAGTASIEASGCNIFKAAACAAALAACAGVCVGSIGTACVQCLAALGASGCIDCL